IRGVAVNNDGRDKASFTAPSVDGQAAVIASAHEASGVDPRTISYVETHGTATPMGDPVEIEGLTRAFRRRTEDTGFCRIGSVKTNVGHMVIAAGAAGVIKTALALHAEQLPASLHFERANPKIDFAHSPFVVNDRLVAWPRSKEPRRAGVSSFGVGGTNAHAVLEEGPLRAASSPAMGSQLVLLSAKSRPALDSMAARLASHLQAHPYENLADVAHTLQVGRSRFAHRLCVVSDSAADAAIALRSTDDPRRVVRTLGAVVPSLVWLFPGQGAQYAGMGKGLYEHDAVFRAAFDECIAALPGVLTFDLKERMFEGGAAALVATGVTQPATFCLEYALAQSWLACGARPVALIGHSVGEFVAAVLAGVMSLADAARLVALRGAMMQDLPGGSMLSVRLPLEKLLERMPAELSLAAENGPTACVVSGPTPAVEAWRARLEALGVAARMLQTSHAFHSSMMDPVLAKFEAEVRKVALSAPSLPIVSTRSGTWMSAQEACDPHYWTRHLREPVRFSPALKTALSRGETAFLEIGPRGTMATLARQHTGAGSNATVAVASLGDTPETEVAALTLARGQLWTLGIELASSAASPGAGRRRVRLPTYPFERKRFWIEAGPGMVPAVSAQPRQLAPGPAALPATSFPSLPMNTPPVSPTSPSSNSPSSRRPALEARLRVLFEEIAGTDLSAAEPSTNFVELGLDSLTLTQAALQVKKHFHVNITFRQLMEKYRSFETLAGFLDSSLPAETASAHPQIQAAVPSQLDPQASGAGAGLVQQLIAQQLQMMQLMSQQLASLNGAALPALASAPPTPTPVANATPTSGKREEAVRYDVKKAFGAIARIHTQSSEVTEHQRARLAAFMRRYIERTRKSKAFTETNRSQLADPRVVNGFRPLTKEITYQIVVERSKGSKLWDIDGNEYVDVLCGFGMNLFGWQPDFVAE
ncbi:MAG TPA: acyltransferase domain-containing protein, partial [Planctomycetota bacterium]|nr:acyltransferase domain-containing protein [Planctomycetota bacterium]